MSVLCQGPLIKKISFNFWNNNSYDSHTGKVVGNISNRKHTENS